jgi:hypothetical protein
MAVGERRGRSRLALLGGIQNLKVRCLMGSLSMVVLCIMVFNLFWLHTLLEDDNVSSGTKAVRSSVLASIDPALSHCQQRRSLRDVQACFASPRQLPARDCDEVTDWSSVQRCLTGRFRPEAQIRHVHIVGERHSGTKFLTNHLQECFPRQRQQGTRSTTTPDYGFKVHRDFLRSKHWFQPILGHDMSQSVVVVLVRDPYQWVTAMLEKPYHSPFHIRRFNGTRGVVPLEWVDFVSRPWSMPLLPGWENRSTTTTRQQHQQHCQMYFSRQEVVPCEYNRSSGFVPTAFANGFEPVYELRRDGSGKAFRHVLELRTEKLVNFVLELGILLDLAGLMIVRYEDVLRNGTDFVIEDLREILQLPAHVKESCTPLPPQPDRLRGRPISKDFRRWIHKHLDRPVEHLLGYA